jgi:hypothetical protein
MGLEQRVVLPRLAGQTGVEDWMKPRVHVVLCVSGRQVELSKLPRLEP